MAVAATRAEGVVLTIERYRIDRVSVRLLPVRLEVENVLDFCFLKVYFADAASAFDTAKDEDLLRQRATKSACFII